jgi:hypothetical protein
MVGGTPGGVRDPSAAPGQPCTIRTACQGQPGSWSCDFHGFRQEEVNEVTDGIGAWEDPGRMCMLRWMGDKDDMARGRCLLRGCEGPSLFLRSGDIHPKQLDGKMATWQPWQGCLPGAPASISGALALLPPLTSRFWGEGVAETILQGP